MLVLSRKPGESVVIPLPNGERLLISITRVAGNRVSVGLDAPKDIRILRTESLTPEEKTEYQVGF